MVRKIGSFIRQADSWNAPHLMNPTKAAMPPAPLTPLLGQVSAYEVPNREQTAGVPLDGRSPCCGTLPPHSVNRRDNWQLFRSAICHPWCP
jgi:hypothetical protein